MMRTKKNSGFTLLEGIISLVIASIIVSGVVAVSIMVQRVMWEASQINRINTEVRSFSDWFCRDVRCAEGIRAATGVVANPVGALVLECPPIDDDEYILADYDDVDLIAYYQTTENGGIVYTRQIMPCAESSRSAVSKTFGNTVAGSAFQGTFSKKPDVFGAFVIFYQFTDTRTFRGKTHSVGVSGSVRLRNKEQAVE